MGVLGQEENIVETAQQTRNKMRPKIQRVAQGTQ